MERKQVRGDEVKKYIEILSKQKLTIRELSIVIKQDYYTVKAMIQYIKEYHKILRCEEIEGQRYYFVDKKTAERVLNG